MLLVSGNQTLPRNPQPLLLTSPWLMSFPTLKDCLGKQVFFCLFNNEETGWADIHCTHLLLTFPQSQENGDIFSKEGEKKEDGKVLAGSAWPSLVLECA